MSYHGISNRVDHIQLIYSPNDHNRKSADGEPSADFVMLKNLTIDKFAVSVDKQSTDIGKKRTEYPH